MLGHPPALALISARQMLLMWVQEMGLGNEGVRR